MIFVDFLQKSGVFLPFLPAKIFRAICVRKPDKNCAFLLDFLRSIWNIYAAYSGLPRYMQHPDKFDALNALDEVDAPLARLTAGYARAPCGL